MKNFVTNSHIFPLLLLFLFTTSFVSSDKSSTGRSQDGVDAEAVVFTPEESFHNITTSSKDFQEISNSNQTTTTTTAGVIIPQWIRDQEEKRRSKVLDKPLESQLKYYEASSSSGKQEKFSEETRESVSTTSTSTSAPSTNYPTTNSSQEEHIARSGGFIATLGGSTLQGQANNKVGGNDGHEQIAVPIVRVSGVQRRNGASVDSGISRRLKMNDPVRRQDLNLDLISLITEAPPVELTSVSPIESSLGGLTGLQGLPPLSLIQFIKLLVAVTPFMIPIVFVPLLIFTIGIFMLPVTRKNVFLDFGDLRSFNQHEYPSATLSSSQSSFHLGSTVKNFTSSVILPRAYTFARQLVDHEQCVERISCEISARYLHYSRWETGNWRSIVNRNWISRLVSYLWRKYPTAERIARSLDHDVQPEIMQNNDVGANNNHERDHAKGRMFEETCNRYVCQPKSLLRKYFI